MNEATQTPGAGTTTGTGAATPAGTTGTPGAAAGSGAASGASSATASSTSTSTTPTTGTGTETATGAGATTTAGSTTDATASGKDAKAPSADSQDVEIKFPEGVTPDQGLVDAYRAKAKELGLDSPKAQALADIFVSRTQEIEKAARQQFEAQQQEWKKALETDKELGGAQLTQTRALVAKARDRIAPPDFVKLVDASGLGDHPEVVRFFARIGKAISEDSIQGTQTPASQGDSEEARLARRYRNSK